MIHNLQKLYFTYQELFNSLKFTINHNVEKTKLIQGKFSSLEEEIESYHGNKGRHLSEKLSEDGPRILITLTLGKVIGKRLNVEKAEASTYFAFVHYLPFTEGKFKRKKSRKMVIR